MSTNKILGTVLARREARALPIPVLLATIGRSAGRQLSEALEPIGLKPRHIAALDALRNGAQAQSALGIAAGVDPAKLVGLLNDLEDEGLVTRKRDKNDRRRHTVELSDLGHTRLAAVDTATDAVARHFVAGLDEAQQAYLAALLSHVSANAAGIPCPEEDGDAPCPTETP